MEKNAMEFQSWEQLVKPYRVAFEKQGDERYRETVVVEPLEHGFGVTLGNALRRVLLSAIPGAAVTSIKISGAFLEFSVLPGVLEDVTEIVLNVKSLNLRLRGEESPQKFVLLAQGPCVVTAGMIQGGSKLEVLDPNQVICTLGPGATFGADLFVSRGKGYFAAPLSVGRRYVGEILLDARFNPVRKVSCQVEHTRVAQSTDYDRLLLTVETNGAISPKEAIGEAARILQDQLQCFVSCDAQTLTKFPSMIEKESRDSSLPPVLFSLVKDLDLPVRCLNCLKNAHIVYLGDLVKKKESDLLRTPNFGRKSLSDINDVLARFGLSLGMEFPDWPPENIDEYLQEHHTVERR